MARLITDAIETGNFHILRNLVESGEVTQKLTRSIATAADYLLASIWARIEDILAEIGRGLTDFSSYPFLVSIGERLHWYYLFSFMVIAFVIYAHGTGAPSRFTLKGFLEFMLPKSVYRHRSTLLDLKFYVFNRIFERLVFVSAVIGSFSIFGEGFEAVLRALMTAPNPEIEATAPVLAAYTVALILTADLGFFLGHYLSHKVPLLWEFHKVHHSAEVLNPLTNYRFHPFDRILLGLCIGITTGVVKGAFGFAFSGELSELLAINLSVLMLFNLTANLRHSHVWLSYGWHLSHVFSSPAQHQIHHGTAARHIDKNFGLLLSVWDWMAGSLYVPRGREEVEFGLTGGEHKEYNSLWRLYTRPIARAGSLLIGRAGR